MKDTRKKRTDLETIMELALSMTDEQRAAFAMFAEGMKMGALARQQ